jgi:hypothetical protein
VVVGVLPFGCASRFNPASDPRPFKPSPHPRVQGMTRVYVNSGTNCKSLDKVYNYNKNAGDTVETTTRLSKTHNSTIKRLY